VTTALSAAADPLANPFADAPQRPSRPAPTRAPLLGHFDPYLFGYAGP
jgi:hypothetical protein